jgi:hypothetical protein
VLSSGDALLLIANTTPWQNPLNGLDTNRDGSVSPIDVLAVINAINEGGSRNLTSSQHEIALGLYLDANGDDRVSPIDALMRINALARSSLSGVGEVPFEAENALLADLYFTSARQDSETADLFTTTKKKTVVEQIEPVIDELARYAETSAKRMNLEDLPDARTIAEFDADEFFAELNLVSSLEKPLDEADDPLP